MRVCGAALIGGGLILSNLSITGSYNSPCESILSSNAVWATESSCGIAHLGTLVIVIALLVTGIGAVLEPFDFVELFAGEASVEVEEVLVFFGPSGEVGFCGHILLDDARRDGRFDPRLGYGFSDGLRDNEGWGAGWWVEHEIAPIEALTEGMLVRLTGCGKTVGRMGFAAGFDDVALRFGEHKSAGCFGVAGDVELLLVVIPMARATQAPEVGWVGGSLVGPVLDVVHFETTCRMAGRVPTDAVAVQDQLGQTIGHNTGRNVRALRAVRRVRRGVG